MLVKIWTRLRNQMDLKNLGNLIKINDSSISFKLVAFDWIEIEKWIDDKSMNEWMIGWMNEWMNDEIGYLSLSPLMRPGNKRRSSTGNNTQTDNQNRWRRLRTKIECCRGNSLSIIVCILLKHSGRVKNLIKGSFTNYSLTACTDIAGAIISTRTLSIGSANGAQCQCTIGTISFKVFFFHSVQIVQKCEKNINSIQKMPL